MIKLHLALSHSLYLLQHLKYGWRFLNFRATALETTIDRLSTLSLVDISARDGRYTLHPLTRAFVRNELLSNVH